MFKKAGTLVVKQKLRQLEQMEDEMQRERRLKDLQVFLTRQASFANVGTTDMDITERASVLSPLASNKGSINKV